MSEKAAGCLHTSRIVTHNVDTLCKSVYLAKEFFFVFVKFHSHFFGRFKIII